MMMKVNILSLLTILFNLSVYSQQCHDKRIRKSWNSLMPDDQLLFIEALKESKASGTYDIFVKVHNNPVNIKWAHGSRGFLPWHRAFLWEFENHLRGLHEKYKCLTIPFWDWERDSGHESHSKILFDFGSVSRGCVNSGPFSNWKDSDGNCLYREFDDSIFFTGEFYLTDIITSSQSYGKTRGFRANLEASPHSAIHNYIGGHMKTFKSVEDPIFWLHHSNIDRLWTLWMDCKNYKLDDPNLFPGSKEDVIPFKDSENILSSFKIEHVFHLDYSYPTTDRIVDLIEYLTPETCQWNKFYPSDNPIDFSNKKIFKLYSSLLKYYNILYDTESIKSEYARITHLDHIQQNILSILTFEECLYDSKEYKIHAKEEWINMLTMEKEKILFHPTCLINKVH